MSDFAITAAAPISLPLQGTQPQVQREIDTPAPAREVELTVIEADPNAAAGLSELALASLYDPRVLGPTETVLNHDRIEKIIEGFDHLRMIFEMIKAQAQEEFGLSPTPQMEGVPSTPSVDLKM